MITLLTVVMALGFIQSPLAEEVRFDFSGHFTDIRDPDNVLNGTGISVNTSTFTGTIIYDSDTLPNETPSPNEAYYTGMSFAIVIDNSYTISTSSPDIVIVNDLPISPGQLYDLIICEEASEEDFSSNLPEAISVLILEINSTFTNASGPLTGIQLPLTLDLEDFTGERYITIEGINSLRIEGEIDTLERFYPDDDDDGVPNYLDLCPDTPAALSVKSNGCLEGDYDNDGDVDGVDLGEFSNHFGMQP